MDIFLYSLRLFAFNPLAAFTVAIILSIGYFRRTHSKKNKIILGVCSVIWWLYSCYEVYITNWRSSLGDMAMRVDLVLFGPLVLGLGVIGFIILIVKYENEEKE